MIVGDSVVIFSGRSATTLYILSLIIYIFSPLVRYRILLGIKMNYRSWNLGKFNIPCVCGTCVAPGAWRVMLCVTSYLWQVTAQSSGLCVARGMTWPVGDTPTPEVTQRAVCCAFHLPVLWMALVVNCYKVCALYKWYWICNGILLIIKLYSVIFLCGLLNFSHCCPGLKGKECWFRLTFYYRQK